MESKVEQLPQTSSAAGIDAGPSLPMLATEAYEALSEFPKRPRRTRPVRADSSEE